LVVAGMVGRQLYTSVQNADARIFTDGQQTIRLFNNGNYTAVLAHNTRKSGTYTENTENDITIISFVTRGITENGNISGNILTFPSEWDDGHGHGNRLRLR
jgi:hypothetical protein